MQAALEKFKDGYYKKENTDKWDSCRKAYESLWVLTGQEATQFMWTADGPPTTDKRSESNHGLNCHCLDWLFFASVSS